MLRHCPIGPPTQPFFGRLLHDYRVRYPLVSLHLEERTPERGWEMLAKGRLSVSFTRCAPELALHCMLNAATASPVNNNAKARPLQRVWGRRGGAGGMVMDEEQ